MDVYVYLKDGNKSEQWNFEGGKQMFSVANIDAVAVIPKLNDCFSGVKSMDLGSFGNKGNMSGNVTTF